MNTFEAKFTLDPTSHYSRNYEVTAEKLLRVGGMLPAWPQFCPPGRDMVEWLQSVYSFGGDEFKGHSFDENGVATYPEDPSMYPVIKIEVREYIIYIYQNAWIAVMSEGEYTMMRMD